MMEKHQRIQNQSIPEEIIQHIQSVLTGKEAARTTILSKSWYTAWLTRPNLDLDYCDFRTTSAFVEFANKTLQRYDESNRKIHTLKLQMDFSGPVSLLGKAMKLGPTDVHITGGCFFSSSLPSEMFASETIVRLSLHYCIYIISDHKVNSSTLKYLSLKRVRDKFWDIISMCPFIEELSLDAMSVLEPGLGVCDIFPKLKVLSLENMEIGEWFFRDLSSRFPCLRDLALHNCWGHGEIQIRSDSLECVSFTCFDDYRRILGMMKTVTLDVPRIRKFKFSGSYVPSISFKKIPREWESYISITTIHSLMIKNSWFLELRQFLHELSPSKIYLSLEIYLSTNTLIEEGCDYTREDIIPRVEKLTFLTREVKSSFHSAILEILFWSCRPKLITLYWSSCPSLPSCHVNNDLTKLICNTLIKKVSDHDGHDHENRDMPALPLHGLEEVNIEFFEDGRRLHWKTLSEAPANSGKTTVKVCLQLKWGTESF